ncbi:hypothetical protein [Frankia canadensis]|uniref:hypothetical protein n=1 Tax=Frankia canadensis TaxID=1836972 RepID=UPI000C7DB45B|nr:hypothetical protein [Frankia canadensis]
MATVARFEISYAAAADLLGGLAPADADEQLRDWTSTALAARLNLDTATFLASAYDTLPVRDPGFADLARQQVGPGRLLAAGRGTAHVLVQAGDPHEARTVGLLLDQYRTDHGSDPDQVAIDRYQLRSDLDTIEVTVGAARPTRDVRAAHGYLTLRVDTAGGLADFLARIQDLSELRKDGSKIWASGWHWPDVPSAPIDAADVSAIQGGYPVAAGRQPPGFSLDPAAGPQPNDEGFAAVHTLIPDLDQNRVRAVLTDQAVRVSVRTQVRDALLQGTPAGDALRRDGLPTDRTQLWALLNLTEGNPVYSQARYEGGLARTNVGMTLFYTDYVAKNWVAGVGSGVPGRAVGGFVPDSEARTPWSQCPAATDAHEERGRLWFGQNDAAFASSGDRFELGGQATRLFARSNGAGGGEVEPSFSFGRGLRYWDQHYQAIADYEPQYARLEQIMRWSGALEWLRGTGAALPAVPDGEVHHSDLTFDSWYAHNTRLRERSPIPFVSPAAAGTAESVIPTPTRTYGDCGLVGIEGGVSLGHLAERTGGRDYHADLPDPLRRAGLFDETSHADPRTGDGSITELAIDDSGRTAGRVQRTISTTGDRSTVRIDASARADIPFGPVRIWRSAAADRTLTTTVTAGRGHVSQQVGYQGHDLGTLDARSDADVVTIQWRRGAVDRALRALRLVQDRWGARLPADLSLGSVGLTTYRDPIGTLLAKTGGPGDPWLSITNGTRPPGDDLAFRIGGPDPNHGTPTFAQAAFVTAPKPHDAQTWWDVRPATGDHGAQAVFAPPPNGTGSRVRVTTPDGATATIFPVGDHVFVPAGDPILGPNGLAQGAALLAEFPRVARAMADAARTKDGLLRGVPLGGDGVALAADDHIELLPADHPWAERVARAVAADPRYATPLIRIVGGRAEHIDPGPFTAVPGSARHGIPLRDVLDGAGTTPVYLHDSLRSTLQVGPGMIVAESLHQDLRVGVNTVLLELTLAHGQDLAAHPDVLIHSGGGAAKVNVLRDQTQALPRQQTQTATPTASPQASAAPSLGAGRPGAGTVLLVCPATGSAATACGD